MNWQRVFDKWSAILPNRRETIIRTYSSTNTLTEEEERELWKHFDASFAEMEKAFDIAFKRDK